MSAMEKFRAALEECRLHAEVLREARADLGAARFSPEEMTALPKERRRLLDQLAYRFVKLQDSMGMKLLPGLLVLAEEPLPESTPFGEKLQRLERLGALESADRWRQLRELRNQLSHEYEDVPELKAEGVNRFVGGVDELLDLWAQAEAFSNRMVEKRDSARMV